jgi:hypothetical protein
VAGITALVMEAHPDWTAQMVRTAIMSTASNHETPDNDYGWGIVDAVQAVDYVFDDVSNQPRAVPNSLVLVSSYPNPVNGIATIQVVLAKAGNGKLTLYDELGREVRSWEKGVWTAGENRVALDVSNLATGSYVARYSGNVGTGINRIVILK